MKKTIYQIFEELNIAYQLYDHPPFFTCAESEDWYQTHIEQPSGDSKNLFLRNKKGDRHFLVVIESHKTLDLKNLADKLAVSKLSFASAERLKKYLNVEPGSVSVLALIHPNAQQIEVIFDEDLWQYQKLHYHPPARNDQTVLLATTDLQKFMSSLPNSCCSMKL